MSDDTPTQRLPEGTTPPRPPAPQPPAAPRPQAADVPTERMDQLPVDDATRILPADRIPQPQAFSAVHEPEVAPYVPLAEPTELLAPAAAVPPPATPEPATTAAEEPRRRNPLLIALIALSAVLLVAVGALLVALLGGDRDPESAPADPGASASPDVQPTPTDAAPDPSDEPEPEPSAPSTPVAPPPPPPGTVESFTASITAVPCEGVGSVPVEFSWRTNGDSVTFSVGYEEAENGPYETGLPATGSIVLDYQCGRDEGEQVYSIAAYAGGSVVGRESVVLWDQ